MFFQHTSQILTKLIAFPDVANLNQKLTGFYGQRFSAEIFESIIKDTKTEPGHSVEFFSANRIYVISETGVSWRLEETGIQVQGAPSQRMTEDRNFEVMCDFGFVHHLDMTDFLVVGLVEKVNFKPAWVSTEMFKQVLAKIDNNEDLDMGIPVITQRIVGTVESEEEPKKEEHSNLKLHKPEGEEPSKDSKEDADIKD